MSMEWKAGTRAYALLGHENAIVFMHYGHPSLGWQTFFDPERMAKALGHVNWEVLRHNDSMSYNGRTMWPAYRNEVNRFIPQVVDPDQQLDAVHEIMAAVAMEEEQLKTLVSAVEESDNSASAPVPPGWVGRLRSKRARLPPSVIAREAQEDDDDDEEGEPSLSLATTRSRREPRKKPHHDAKAITERVAAAYGGPPATVYANSQEEMQADAERLVHLGAAAASQSQKASKTLRLEDEDVVSDYDDEADADAGEADADADEAVADVLRQEADEGHPVVGRKRLPRRSQLMEDDDNHGEASPLKMGKRPYIAYGQVEDVDDDDGEEHQPIEAEDEEGEVVVEHSTLAETAAMATANATVLTAFIKLATHIADEHDHDGAGRNASMQRQLKKVQDHILELSRTLMAQTPLDSSKGKSWKHAVIPDTDGTEVRMSECTAEIGIKWSALSEETRRRIAERSSQLHLQVYGIYPKKKNMMTPRGPTPIYFYNNATAEQTIRVAIREILRPGGLAMGVAAAGQQ